MLKEVKSNSAPICDLMDRYRMGHGYFSTCPCCLEPGSEDLKHIFFVCGRWNNKRYLIPNYDNHGFKLSKTTTSLECTLKGRPSRSVICVQVIELRLHTFLLFLLSIQTVGSFSPRPLHEPSAIRLKWPWRADGVPSPPRPLSPPCAWLSVRLIWQCICGILWE